MVENNFKIEVPITLDSKSSKAGEGLAKDFLSNIKGKFSGFGGGSKSGSSSQMAPGIGKIAGSVGIIAALWQGIAPLLKPVLKMFNILLTLLLLPLMPLIRQMITGLAKTAANVGTAQEEAAASGGNIFLAGLAEVLKSPTIWAVAGAGLLAGVVGGAAVAGTILAALAFGIIWDSLTSDSEGETDLKSLLGQSLLAGVAGGIAALVFGAGVLPAIAIGLLVFSTNLGVKFLADAVNEGDFWKAIWGIAKGSLAIGLVAGGIVLLLGLGLGAAAMTELAIGTIIFTIFASWKINEKKKELTEKIFDILPKEYGEEVSIGTALLDTHLEDQGKELNGLTRSWNALKATGLAVLADLVLSTDGLGKMLGSPSKGSYPLVYSLNLASDSFIQFKNVVIGMISAELIPSVNILGETFVYTLKKIGYEWQIMGNTAVEQTNKVIQNLNRIPRSITTTHWIRTRYR